VLIDSGKLFFGRPLGLSVSGSLIEAMGGCFDVSQRTGGGTVFSAVLPRRMEIQPVTRDD
jgi:signal transduction histidine kinase